MSSNLHMKHIWHLIGIFVSGIYMTMGFEINVAVCCFGQVAKTVYAISL